MLFTELRFLAFFVVAFCVYWTLRKNGARKCWLLAISYLFYAGWDWRFLGLILISTLVDYVAGLSLGKEDKPQSQRKFWLAVSLFINLGILGFFKYYNFFAESATAFTDWMGLPLSLRTLEIVLPVGISFYTFQTLSYTIDVYRRKLKPVKSLLDFSLFVAFFPQLVAGPIVRASDFLPQLKGARCFSTINVRAALLLFFYGFVKKSCVADNFAVVVDAVYASPGDYGVMSEWIAMWLYYVQIYCDFSGYSDMAIATAALFGYQLALNFDFPFVARSVAGFWRRWHISMTGWFRDYLFLPLGGYRGGKLRSSLNLWAVFDDLWFVARRELDLCAIRLLPRRHVGCGRSAPPQQ